MLVLLGRPLAIAAAILIGATLGGCDHYRPPRAGPPGRADLAPARPIRVAFASAAAVRLEAPGATAPVTLVVRELAGPLVRASADSVTLKVWAGRDATGAAFHPPPGAEATVARTAGVRLEVRAFDEAGTRRGALAGAAVLAVVALVWYALSHMTT